MKQDSAHGSIFRTAYFLFGIILVIGVMMQVYYPLHFPEELDSTTLKLVGAPMLVVCTLIIFYSKSELAIYDQPSEPGFATTKVVSTGLFNYSRNPLYLGLLFGMLGLGVSINMPWWIIMALPTIIVTEFYLIRPEEKYLVKKFGDEYRQYMEKVSRWI